MDSVKLNIAFCQNSAMTMITTGTGSVNEPARNAVANRSLVGDLEGLSPVLHRRFIVLRQELETNILPLNQLPGYTDHGVKHARNIQESLGRLIPNHIPEPLTAFEIFVLLCATLLHDVGMQLNRTPDEPADQIRSDHYIRSRDFVLKNNKGLGLSDHEARIVAEVCRAHGMPNLDHLDSTDPSIHGHGTVRMRLLSALLRLADILDLTAERAPTIVSENKALSPTSAPHWDIHQHISDVRIEESSWTIAIHVMLETGRSEEPFYRLQQCVQAELDTTSPVLRAAGIFFRVIDLVFPGRTRNLDAKPVDNPFILLKAFDLRNENRFAGRDREIDRMVELILSRRVVLLIGESGVGKTSLVEGGLLPRLRQFDFAVHRFSFQGEPVLQMLRALKIKGSPHAGRDAVALIRQRLTSTGRKKKVLLVVTGHSAVVGSAVFRPN
jgi:hypothetical protein